jgi:hypothetical protein
MSALAYRFAIDRLPNLHFFEPTKQFLTLMKSIVRGRLVVDCGAGVGHVTKLLLDNDIRACAIDTTERDQPACAVAPLDATMFPFSQDMVALIARPCSGIWIHETFTQAISRGADMLYVGVERNFERDLVDIPYKVRRLRKNIGKEQESAYLVTR